MVVGLAQDLFQARVYRGIGPLDLAVVAVFLFLLLQRPYLARQGLRRAFLPIFWISLLILFVIVAGFFNDGLTAPQLAGGYVHFVRCLLLMALGYIVGISIGGARDGDRFTALSLSSLAALAIFDLIFLARTPSWEVASSYLGHLPESGVFDWNSIGSLGGLLVPLGSVYLLKSRGIRTAFGFVALAMGGAVVIWSASRLGISLALAGSLLAMLFLPREQQVRWVKGALISVVLIGPLLLVGRSTTAVAEKLQQKQETYLVNLYEVRIQQLFLNRLRDWNDSSQDLIFGDGATWGHNHIVTVGAKAGLPSLGLYFGFLGSCLLSIVRNKNKGRLLGVGMFSLVMAALFVADLSFTAPLFAWTSFLCLGWFAGPWPWENSKRRTLDG